MGKNKTDSGKFVIRKATAGDYGRVKELLVQSGQITPDVFTKKRYENTLEDFNKYSLVAQKDGKVVGYIFGFDDSGRSGKSKFYGYLGRLVVDSEYRNMGIGKALIEESMAEFKKVGYKTVFAGVHKLNTSSKRLFEKHGFRDDDLMLLRYLDL